jgi:ArsR family transcriptional regulator
MTKDVVVSALIALGNECRLGTYRTLVEVSPAGIASADLANMHGVSRSVMSFHLKQLHAANLVQTKNEGRSVIYSVKSETMDGVIAFLLQYCRNTGPGAGAEMIKELTRKPRSLRAQPPVVELASKKKTILKIAIPSKQRQ